MICFVFLAIAIILYILTEVVAEKFCSITAPICLAVIATIFLVVGSIQTICFINNHVSYKANCAEVALTRDMYIDELKNYENTRSNGVTGSETYLLLRKEIVDFNKNVIYAKANDNIWLNYSWTNPAYLTVNAIEVW